MKQASLASVLIMHHHLAPEDIVPMPSSIHNASRPPSFKDEKPTVEEVEVAQPKTRDWNDRDTALDVDAHPGFWGKVFKQNPSKQFMDDVVEMNKTELNANDVKRIERRIYVGLPPCFRLLGANLRRLVAHHAMPGYLLRGTSSLVQRR